MKKNPARNTYLKKQVSKLLEKINNSIDVDKRLSNEDIIGSIAHCKMLIKTRNDYIKKLRLRKLLTCDIL